MSPNASAQTRAFACLAAAALLLCATIVAIHRESPRTAISAHGFLHSALTYQIADRPFELPPENPFFAGEPVRYYWFFHALGAGIGGLLGLDPLRSLEILILLGSAALFAAAGGLARALYGRAMPGLWIAFLVLAGAKPMAALVTAWRMLRVGPSLFEHDYLWGLVHPVMKVMRVYDPFALWGPLLNFFFNITSRPLAIVSLLFMLWALHAVLSRGGAARAAGLALATALCGAFSMLFGVSSVGALGAAVAILALASRRRGPDALGAAVAAHAPLAIAALLAGLGLSALTFAHIALSAGGGGDEPSLRLLGPAQWGGALLAMAESACVTLPLCALAIWRARGAQRDFLALLFVAIAIYMAGATVVALPIGSQNNFFQAALVPLAVGAVGALVDAEGRILPRRAALVFALFAPTAALIVFAYLGRPPVPIAFEGARLVRTPAEAPLPRLYAWIDRSTAPDAVFVIDPRRPLRAMSGNTAELPALTKRALFTVRKTHYIAADHPDVERRNRIALALVQGRELAARDRRYIGELGRPIYIVSDDAGGQRTDAALARLEARHGVPVFEAEGVRVYRYAAAAAPAQEQEP